MFWILSRYSFGPAFEHTVIVKIETDFHADRKMSNSIMFDFSEQMMEDESKFSPPEGLECYPADERIRVKFASLDDLKEKKKYSLEEFFMKKLMK